MLRTLFAVTTLALATWANSSADAENPVYADPQKVDEDFAYQGEYQGSITTENGDQPVGVQVIALGQGKFRAVAYLGGLPGAGWNKEPKIEADGQKDATGLVIFRGETGSGRLQDGVLTVINREGQKVGMLKRIERTSSTLGQKPPTGAVVLFDGTNVDAWEGGRKTDDGLLMEGTTSKQKFGDHKLHLEFRLPYQPFDGGQGRGNSGLYLQGRYEVQILDSFGLEGRDNECGGIYSVGAPAVNMCLPPLAWQTYDVEYTAARYDAAGKLVAQPRVTVLHNGTVIHDHLALPGDRSTTAAPVPPGPEKGPVYLQNHGNPLRFRNIWVLEKK